MYSTTTLHNSVDILNNLIELFVIGLISNGNANFNKIILTRVTLLYLFS